MKEFTQHFWDAPFRPLFLAAYIWAAITVAWWPLAVPLDIVMPAFPSWPLWHVHELLFGFAAAAIAGYLLTALPSWTGNPPLTRRATQILVALWILARGSNANAEFLHPLALVGSNLLFFALLGGIILVQTYRALAFHRLWFGLFVLLLGGIDGFFLLQVSLGNLSVAHETAQGAVFVIAFLCVTVGGKAIPAFIRNWLLSNGQQNARVIDRPRVQFFCQCLLALAILAFFSGLDTLAACGFLATAGAVFWQVAGWQIRSTPANPLLIALVASYLWLPLGLVLTALVLIFGLDYPLADAVHALAIGAMSGLIMAISGRAACHQPDGILRANWGLGVGFVLMWLTTCSRLLAPIGGDFNQAILALAGILWCSAWLSFIIGFVPALKGPVIRPVLSGRKHPDM